MATEAIEEIQTDTTVETQDSVETPKTDAADVPAPETKDVEPTWRDDWRQRMAGEDDKALKRLERFKSPEDLFRSYRNLEQKLSSGEVKAALPENATEDEIKAYREASGIPQEPDGYLESLPDGLVVGEEDKPVMGEFLKAMHEANTPPDAVHKALDWYYKDREDRISALHEEDKRYAMESEEELRAEWGGEYRANYNAAMQFIDSAPGQVGENLKGARLADGSPLVANPDVMRWLVNTATEVNPAATIVPSTPGREAASIDGRITEIEKMMRNDSQSYYKDEKVQEEYRKLLDARQRLAS